ncbi:MAG: hypothetical protein NZM11_10885 [Anaerolineales bacterium]|nr:hypothetical protein [Anaerolineales bacterium]
MPRYEVVAVRPETPEEARLRQWWAEQAVTAPDNLEAAARQIIGLVSGLLGVLFGVLTLAAEPLPVYLQRDDVKFAGVAAIVLLLLALLAGLAVVFPQSVAVPRARPDEQAAQFAALLGRKSGALGLAAVCFGLGVVALGAALIIALLSL